MYSYAVNNNNAATANLAACSNNSINENRYNSEKLAKSSAVYRLKKILKPLVTLLKSKSHKTQSVKSSNSDYVDQRRSIISYIDDFDCDYDNSANERLEAELVAELEQCHATDAAILVLEDQQLRLQPVVPEELYVPVHFARTEAGTFFWTAMPAREVDEDLIQPAHCYSEEQQYAQQAYADRWAQA
ncbi:enhancer of split malpha protein-like [Anopheles maculipalpis]|uniref:enhancer of split malpha protein-like n=1 Tax=Anopheles maculipalpis TaxID=1496333 RepID=UPI002159A273|nr:enhancer of split malpha protein-like [Anopheles maculipalpis]